MTSETAKAKKSEYVLKLFISGASPNSLKAINNLKEILEANIKGRYDLQIIDVYKEHSIAIKEQVVALPMLIKQFPLPERRLIGDMSETRKVISSLGIDINDEV